MQNKPLDAKILASGNNSRRLRAKRELRRKPWPLLSASDCSRGIACMAIGRGQVGAKRAVFAGMSTFIVRQMKLGGMERKRSLAAVCRD